MKGDLTIVPIRHDGSELWLAHTRIDLDYDCGLIDIIGGLDTSPIPEGKTFEWYTSRGIEVMRTDVCGVLLRLVLAREFRKIVLRKGETSPWNVGVLQFMKALPPDTPVVLWWH